MKRINIFLFLALFLFAGSLQAQEVKPRLAGLEQDSIYMALLGRDALLQSRIDSLMHEAAGIRKRFRSEPEAREELTRSILALEDQLFSLRAEKGGIIDRINTIEQEWVLHEVEQRTTASDEGDQGEEEVLLSRYESAPRLRNLVANACFKQEIRPADYAILLEAQRRENVAAATVECYAENYARLLDMQQQNLTTTQQREADSLYTGMIALGEENRRLEDSLRNTWSYIYDNKGFAYTYLLDRMGLESLLDRQIETLSEARHQAERVEGAYVSDALAAYFIQKRALVDCEVALAEAFRLSEARDSLMREIEYLESVDYRLPHIEPERRYLLDYEEIGFSSPSKYNAQHPIPECRIYEHGTIYRIRLGAYKYKQQVSIFRGVYPLSINREGGRYVYYTGGFATKPEARLACELLRKKGFRQPEIVRWVDGVQESVAEDEPEARFRVEIPSSEPLSDEVRATVRALAADKELARVGQTFIIGTFEDQAVAESLARAIRLADSSLSVQVTSCEE